MIRMKFQVALLSAVVSMVACGPSGPQNNLLSEDEGEHVDTDENELYDYYDEYEGEDENMQDGMDEEDGESVELPEWMDVDLDRLSIDKITLLSSAKNLEQLMKLLELTNEQQNKLEETGPVEIGTRTVGDEEIAECKPELEVVKLESPPNILYLPQCYRLPRCGGCCTGSLLSCQPTSTKNIKLKVMEMTSPHRSRRSTVRRRRTRGAVARYVMVDQVKHSECRCQCRIKEHHCDKSIQEYKEAECACVCKNREEEAECATQNTRYWDPKSCSCRCKKTLECSTGEEFSQNTCRCAPIAIGGRSFNSDTNVCDSFCVNGEPVKCSCKEGWRGKRCIKPICDRGCVHGSCVSPDTCECQEGWRGDQCQIPICDSGCVHGRCVSPGTCECQRGWRGDQCQNSICDPGCVHGSCVSPDTCECQEGWRGDQCQIPICVHGCVHGKCVSPNTCECQRGWRGDQCQEYICECQKGRQGDQCQNNCICIPIDKCGPLRSLSRLRTPENRNVLKKATCGGGHNPPKVYCPSLLPSYCGRPAIDNDPVYDEKEVEIGTRIFGGEENTMGKYPWMALLGYTDSNNTDVFHYRGGGSVINERYVLTAAHSVRDLGSRKLSTVTVVLGEWDRSTEEDCDESDICLPAPLRYKAEKVIVHPTYNTRGRFSDDIALIRLDAPVNINSASFIRAVCLPEPSMDIHQLKQTYKRNRKELELSVAGWGVTEDGKNSDKLLEVNLPLIKDSVCNTTYYGIILPEQICAGGQHGEDSCSGDNGGPLVLPGLSSTDPYIQVGIVSFGPNRCGRQNIPGVYTEVSKYREWIEENLDP